METKWLYQMMNLITVITGNVQLISAEYEGRSELVFFFEDSKIPLLHWLYIMLWLIDDLTKKYWY